MARGRSWVFISTYLLELLKEFSELSEMLSAFQQMRVASPCPRLQVVFQDRGT